MTNLSNSFQSKNLAIINLGSHLNSASTFSYKNRVNRIRISTDSIYLKPKIRSFYPLNKVSSFFNDVLSLFKAPVE